MEKIEKNNENLGNCSCPKCPSYNDCSKKKAEKLFCSDEVKNNCEFKSNGCICPMCIVHRQFKLEKIYYCIHGPASEIE